ncbi:M48 family metallopeptidase [Nocardioides jiangxiensis]|uniref:M48 family metallopeptidase n=1 Tax=Nocardioides jiangxiensis TaxID=3064524 RepID=A0ABT9B813_9ACTN|nr:M48 family metallopeptidase [Nocardioides sp. WY-20]MDO7869283.1 M48 family metallopeptidase [Nocardioides sp. WY-20]
MAGRPPQDLAPEPDRRLTDRTVGAALVVAGLVLLAWLLTAVVPWHPVPGGRPQPVPADSVFTPREIDRAEAWARLGRLISWSSLAISLAVSSWLGFTSRGARLLGRSRMPWWASVMALTFLVSGIGQLATLPVTLMAWQQRTRVGLTEQSLAGVLRDQAVGFAYTVVISSIALLAIIGIARRLPRAWPAVVALAGSVLVVGSSYLWPVLVEPAFNHFTPLQDPLLERGIQQLAQREGVHVDEVLVSDASRRTTTLNAYVSGFGDSRRVVLYDTLLKDLDRREVLSVVGHELAHARHGDVEAGTVLGVGGTVVGVGLLALVIGAPGVRRRAGVYGIGDPRVVALLLALGAWGTLATMPLQNGVSRQFETRADVDALKATGDPVAFVRMQRALAVTSLADPTPPAWSQWWFGSHPTVLQRIALAGVR